MEKSETDVYIIIIITCRPSLPLLKPEWADEAVAGKDSSVTFWAQPSHSALMKKELIKKLIDRRTDS